MNAGGVGRAANETQAGIDVRAIFGGRVVLSDEKIKRPHPAAASASMPAPGPRLPTATPNLNATLPPITVRRSGYRVPYSTGLLDTLSHTRSIDFLIESEVPSAMPLGPGCDGPVRRNARRDVLGCRCRPNE